MSVEQDYMMRMIKDMSRLMARILFGKSEMVYELPTVQEYTAADHLYEKLLTLLHEGKINEAENLLFEEIDSGDIQQFRMAVSFYLEINEFDEEYLEEHNYSREEISEGIKSAAEKFGRLDLVNQLL